MASSVPLGSLPGSILPEPRRHEALQIFLRYDFARWEREWLARQPKFEIENVRFEHRVDWRDNWLSIQNAHDQRASIWNVAFGMITLAQLGPIWIVAI